MEWKEQDGHGLVDLKFRCNDGKQYIMTSNSKGNWNRALDCNNGFGQTRARELTLDGLTNVYVSCVDGKTFMPSNANKRGHLDYTQSCPKGAKITGFETQEHMRHSNTGIHNSGIVNYRFMCSNLQGKGTSLGKYSSSDIANISLICY